MGAVLCKIATLHGNGQHANSSCDSMLQPLRGSPRHEEQPLSAASLQALPALSESELPPAVGLVLKLASEAPASCTHAVHVVHSRIKSRPDVSPGTLDAVRLAVSQHMDIAQAILADIDSECRSSKPASPVEVGSHVAQSRAVHMSHQHVI